MIAAEQIDFIKRAWDVLLLFTIPVGGGIPGGVLLAQSRELGWPVMMILYFISDVILAFVFEPIMHGFIKASRKSLFAFKIKEILKMSTNRATAHFGTKLGPLGLILVSFGVDPMTGRVATRTQGYGFIAGWAMAITGDMFYFSIIMISTLWLNHILGDGTWTMVIILAAMILMPPIIRRLRQKK